MNSVERKALYNLLRMNWLNDSTLAVENWQVEDYRALPLTTLFEKLQALEIHLDKASYIAYAEECDSPEDLTEYFIADRTVKPQVEDQIYLLVFELWRRLMSEKPSLSIFGEEIDQQIFLYDHNQMQDPIALQDAIANLLNILEENVDAGIEPKEAFARISAYCANDLETFIYDFIAEQIDIENESYAHELLEDFSAYFVNNRWFLLLRARLLSHTNIKTAQRLLSQLTEDHLEDQDLEFHFELLSLMAEAGTSPLFRTLVTKIIPILKTEEDFQDLLTICIEYYHRLDLEQAEQQIQSILDKRVTKSLSQTLDTKDRDLTLLIQIIEP